MNGIMGESGAETVPALRRAVRILDFVSSAESAPNAADLARLMAIPKSTAHGLLSAMVELGLLARSQEGAYRPGSHIMQWASGFLAQQNIVREFQNHFAENSALSEHTVTLTVLDGTDVTYLGCQNSTKPLGFTFRIGMRLPAVFTATGKAQLETVPPHRLEDMFGDDWPEPMTRSSVKNLAALKEELKEIRKRGYSIDDGQIREGMICLGAAIREFSGRSIGGIAISLIESEALPDVLDRLGQELRRTADALSKRLGA
ncbi:IclR family transcriptional regulator [Methylobacterium sp. Leaf123]|uniref:IclR family transcriptional regulator n=1 Tax=Methylobacterium sp. Leaf123 TaxID=1736264 RepID=UPI0006F1E846|nr:IclR family transcriptional regulator [Methylobacterium sp. Leaf123]KQQ27133.1 IclR family transcriptional regulator [Methylobacterium sp. Leaf123]